MAGEEVSSLSLPHNVEACRQLAGSVLKSSSLPGARLLLQHGVSPAFVFFSAAELNMIDIMNELWKKHKSKINLDTAVLRAEGGDFRETPLTVAAKYGAFCAVEWLLNHGVNVDSLASYGPNNGPITALWTAASNGYVRICQKLLDHGADVNTYNRSTNNTALYISVQNGHGIVASQLIRAGANVNDPRGTAPLLVAICRGKPDMVALLLNAGANVPTTDAFRALHSINGLRKSALSSKQFKLTDHDIMMITALLKGSSDKPDFPAAFETSRSLERKGKFREALHENANAQIELERTDGPPGLLQISPAWAQLLLDGRRLMDAVYGPKGSDGRISQWDRHKFYATDKHPPALQFYAWVNHKNKIYRHGGIDFISVQQVPSLDALWAFNKDTRQWEDIKTSGPSPGPRAHHCAAVVADSMYVYGGETKVLRRHDSKVYALSLTTMTWEAQKAKGGARPPDRTDASMVAYKGKLYLFGGTGTSSDRDLADLWVYNVTTHKWKELKPGLQARHNHNMWAARDKLYVLGGLAFSPNATNNTDGLHTIQDLQVYDIANNEWSRVRCVGEDPWNLAEYTALPLYRGEEEPSAVIVFGGYQYVHVSVFPNMQEATARYGTELNQARLPYFNRLLRLDLETMVWTKLEALQASDSTPTAQAWAYEAMDRSGIVLGGGYGLNAHSKAAPGKERLSSISLGLGNDALEMAIMSRLVEESVVLEEKGYHPTSHSSVFEVRFEDERKCCAAKDAAAGKGWAWELADAPGTLRPSMEMDSRLGSPLLYRHLGLCDGDFRHPPKDANGKVLTIQDDDEQTLGRRVVLQGLKGRPELNGSTARCGPWISDKGRYQVFLSNYERHAPATLAVKPVNLRYSPKLWDFDLKGFFGAGIKESPDLIGIWSDVGGKDTHNPFVRQPEEVDEKNTKVCTDTYRGPLSAEANAVVLALNCETKTRNGILIVGRLPTDKLEKKAAEGDRVAKEKLARVALYSEFVDRIRRDDTARVNAWQENTVAGRDESKWGDWVELTVSFDSLVPVIERTLLVSPNISMQRLHLQILCPAIGWAPNIHAYAFRRITPNQDPAGKTKTERMKDLEKKSMAVLDSLEQECWVGPNKSSALDIFFQPLYVGGAMADDTKILLGDFLSEEGESSLQYVHDFGDWWSHTIKLCKTPEKPPDGVSVAHLVSGTGGCPPENAGGINSYTNCISKLTGLDGITPNMVNDPELETIDNNAITVDPGSSLWWQYLNAEVRCKENFTGRAFNPLEFNIEQHRSSLRNALLQRLDKKGTEKFQAVYVNFETGISSTGVSSEGLTAPVLKKETNPTRMCAVCGVTAGLKVCGGCGKVAFCSRDHQVAFWKEHKRACRLEQAKRTEEK